MRAGRVVLGSAVALLVVGLVVGLAVGVRRADFGGAADSADSADAADSAGAAGAADVGGAAGAVHGGRSAAPAVPPARVCGNEVVLAGPSKPPAGAIVVTTSQQLDTRTDQSPPGTTFWLAPGLHTLGSGPYDQVLPKDGNTYLGAPGAVLDGQRRNLYAFTGPASDVSVRHLTIQNFGPRGANNDESVVNHDTGAGWLIEANTIRLNAGSGAMVGSRGVLRANCIARNGQGAFGTYRPGGVSDLVVEGNEITGNNTDDWERLRPGCGCTGGGKFWEVNGAVVRDNWVHDNRGVGLWADTGNVGFAFEGNYLADNDAEGLVYETSYNAVIRGNTFVRNGHVEGPTNKSFPTGALYISESGSDPRVRGDHSTRFEISGNVFRDNWSGVVLWENADRFSGSPADTSGAGTLVNPGVVTAKTCTAATIGSQPHFADCRWKTQNVQVHHNTFALDPARMPATCGSASGCGYNGIFSNWGTYPDWSPYQGSAVQDAIMFRQNNRFFANTYSGPWTFVARAQGSAANWATWQGSPYNQDRDSVILLPRPTTGER